MRVDAKKFLLDLRDLLVEAKIAVGEFEYTYGNYDSSGNEIKEGIPTLTTDFCEIGFYDENIYLVIILNSDSFSKRFFESIKELENVSIYGFKNFKENFYPQNKNYNSLFKKINEEKYFQVQINIKPTKPEELAKMHIQISEKFKSNKTKIINQLSTDAKLLK